MNLDLGPHQYEIIQVVVGLLGLLVLFLYTSIPRVKNSTRNNWFKKRYVSCLIDIDIPGEINDVTYDEEDNVFIITHTLDDLTTRKLLDGRSTTLRHSASRHGVCSEKLGCFSDKTSLYVQESDGVAIYDGTTLQLREKRKGWKVYYDSLIDDAGEITIGVRYTLARRRVFDMYGSRYFSHYHPINIMEYTPMFNQAIGALSGSCMNPNIVCICSKLKQFGPYQIVVYRIKEWDFLLRKFF